MRGHDWSLLCQVSVLFCVVCYFSELIKLESIKKSSMNFMGILYKLQTGIRFLKNRTGRLAGVAYLLFIWFILNGESL